MSKSVNKVFLLGNLGDAPVLNHTSSGTPVTNVSLATSERWNDKDSGEKVERTEWHRLVFFGSLAEITCAHLRKGAKVHVEGRLRTQRWVDDDGVERWTTEIVASELAMLGSPRNADKRNGAREDDEDDQGKAANRSKATSSARKRASVQRRAKREAAHAEADASDVPF